MSFVSYPHLIPLISGQTFEFTIAGEKVWELNGALFSHQPSITKPENIPWFGW